jgi:hypothetical protein
MNLIALGVSIYTFQQDTYKLFDLMLHNLKNVINIF